MTRNPDPTPKSRIGLTTSLILVMSGVLGAVATLVILWNARMVDAENETAARLLAISISDAIQSFGEVGEMDGLATLVEALNEQEEIGSVEAIRGPNTEADFGEREGSAPRDDLQRAVLASGKFERAVDKATNHLRFVQPILNAETCQECHTSAPPGAPLGVADVVISTASAAHAKNQFALVVGSVFFVASVLCSLLLMMIVKVKVVRPIESFAGRLDRQAKELTVSARDMNISSERFADGASRQAAALEQTSAALHQTKEMIHENSQHANEAEREIIAAKSVAEEGGRIIGDLNKAMGAISDSSSKIGAINRLIEEVAFQTNLLALNAAVEAARAGDHGKGFAVVAGEVRGLAQRASEASKDTSELVQISVDNVKGGVHVSHQVDEKMTQIVEDVATMSRLMNAIADASRQQSERMEEINSAMSDMDSVTQENAGAAQRAADAAARLQSHAATVEDMVQQLMGLVAAS
ncbi:MAG: methyl-accepting chemotaxis protein [Candidatus Eisenbacteria bacterium]